MGTPVVSTDCETGPREILDGGGSGGWCRCGTPYALAEAIDATLSNPPKPVATADLHAYRHAVAVDNYARTLVA